MKTVFLLLLLTLSLNPVAESDLSDRDNETLVETVAGFWKAQQQNDRVKAMEFVHPEDLNAFLNQKPARIRGWKIAEIKPGETEGEVKVRVEYSLETYPGTAFKVASLDTWQQVDGEWKVRIKQPSRSAMEALFGQAKTLGREKRNGEITIRPDTIRFFKLNLKQPAFIWVENQLDTPAEITLLDYDRQLIKVTEMPGIIRPGENARIRLEYVGGQQDQENLTTPVLLEVTSGDQVFKKEIPAVYNYMNEALRWLRGRQQQPDADQGIRLPE